MFSNNKLHLENINVNLKIINSPKFSIESEQSFKRIDKWNSVKISRLNNFQTDVIFLTINMKDLKELSLHNVSGSISINGFEKHILILSKDSRVNISDLQMDSFSIKSIRSSFNIDNFKGNNVDFHLNQSNFNIDNSYFLNLKNVCIGSRFLFNSINAYVVNVTHSTCVNQSKAKMNVIREITYHTEQQSNLVISGEAISIESKFYYNENNKKVYLNTFCSKKIQKFHQAITERALYALKKFEVEFGAEYKTLSFGSKKVPFFIFEAEAHEHTQMIHRVNNYISQNNEIYNDDIEITIENEKELEKIFKKIEDNVNSISAMNFLFKNTDVKNYVRDIRNNIRIDRKQLKNLKKERQKEVEKNEETKKHIVDFKPLIDILDKDYPTEFINKNNRTLIFDLIKDVKSEEPILNKMQKNKLLKLVNLFELNNQYLKAIVKF